MLHRLSFDSTIFIGTGKTNISYELDFCHADVHERDKGFNIVTKRYGFMVNVTYHLGFGKRKFSSTERVTVVLGPEITQEYNRVMDSGVAMTEYLASELKSQKTIDAFHASLLPVIEKWIEKNKD